MTAGDYYSEEEGEKPAHGINSNSQVEPQGDPERWGDEPDFIINTLGGVLRCA